MADYKRFVSYMYEYENGVKKRNVGYARVELRNGECKFTIYMHMVGQSEGIFPTYLIHRPMDEMELVYLGDSFVKNQIMDSRLTASASNVMDSGYKFSDMGGILLFLNSKVFYATQWDDKPVILNEVLEALKPKPKEAIKAAEEKPELTQSVTAGQKEKTEEKLADREEKIDDEKVLYAKKETADEKTTYTKEETADEKSKHEEGKISDKELAYREETASDNKPANMEKESSEKKVINTVQLTSDKKLADLKEASTSSNSQIPLYMLPRGWKTREGVRAVHSKPPINPWDLVDKYKGQETESRKAGGHLSKDIDQPKEAHKENPLIAKIFNNYPRIYPFEDNEIKRCVKIEPKDIGILPSDMWTLSSNSFLLHGYYCYHHLIFAEIINRYGSSYILGVPGIYHNRERFMARMFGFESFKSIRKRELKQGDFGYWYIEVKL